MDASGAVKGFNDLGKAADRNLGKTDQRLDQFASRFQKAGAGMLAGAGLAAAGLYKAGQSAANLEQALGGTEAVFGEASGVIDDFAKKAASAAGLSESAFRAATTSIGGQLKGLGFTVEEAADQAVKLSQVAADLTATYGGTTAEAVAALGAAFRGEADPAERFNLFLNQTRVNAKAVELGLAETTSGVDAHAKAQATLALITEQSADAQGQFGREANTAAGSIAIFKAETENLMASIGGAVAPLLAEVAGAVGGLVSNFNSLDEPQKAAISRFALISTGALGFAGAASFTAGKIIDMRQNLSGLVSKLSDGAGGLSKLGKAAGVAGVALSVLAIKSIGDEFRRTVVDVDEYADALRNLTAAGLEQTEQNILAADAFGNLDTIVSQLAEQNGVAATKFVDIAEAAGIGADQIARYRQEITDNQRVQAQAIIDQDANSAAISETVDELGGVGPAYRSAVGGVDAMTTAVDRQKAALDEAKGSLDLFKRGLEDAFGDLDLQAATDRRAQDVEDIGHRFVEAQQAVTDAKQRVQDLLATPEKDRSASFGRDLAAAQEEVQRALDETSRALEGNSVAALTNREDVRGLVDDIGKVIEAHRTEGASIEELQTIRALERQGLIDTLEQLGFNRAEIDEYVAAIDRIPITKATTITMETQQAEANLQKVIDLLDRIESLKKAGLGFSVDTLQAESQLQRNAGAVPSSSIPAATSQTNNITINNPTQEPANTSIRKVRGELAA